MKEVSFPVGYRLETLQRDHPREFFSSGEKSVDEWLRTKALQNQEKHLSVTKVLVSASNALAGYYTLATAQVDFHDLPDEITRRLPKRMLPVAVLAWLGVDQGYQGQGFGERLMAQALRDCHAAGQTFPFVGVILDCVNDEAKRFYGRWDFRELPGNPYRLILSASALNMMFKSD